MQQPLSSKQPGVKEVTKAMQQLDQTTHQNTSVAQQSSVTALTLKAQAKDLSLAVEDLMAVVDGAQKSNPRDNVVQFNKNLSKSHTSDVSEKQPVSTLQASGYDSAIPSSDDSRFEDL